MGSNPTGYILKIHSTKPCVAGALKNGLGVLEHKNGLVWLLAEFIDVNKMRCCAHLRDRRIAIFNPATTRLATTHVRNFCFLESGATTTEDFEYPWNTSLFSLVGKAPAQ